MITGENGIMKKKYVLMQRDIEDQKEEIKALQTKEKELHEQIKILEKEVSAHKKEIKTRDLSIGEKEKRIYELKKKNQELDKFKFVLDFKIRELKEQIEPRQMEIMAMRDKIKSMDVELEKFHNSNSALDSLIGDLRSKIDTLQNESKGVRTNAKTLENTIVTCRSDIQNAIKFIQTPSVLVESISKVVEKYGGLENIRPRIDPGMNICFLCLGYWLMYCLLVCVEVQEEYDRHKEFLQKSIADLKRAVEQDSLSHMTLNNSIRESNMALIHEINTQREINRNLKLTVSADIGRIRHLAQSMSNNTKKKPTSAGAAAPTGGISSKTPPLPVIATSTTPRGGLLQSTVEVATASAADGEFSDPSDILERNRKRIFALRSAIHELESRNNKAAINLSKAYSREMLPPMDNASGLKQIKSLPPVTDGSGGGDAFSPVTRQDIGNTYATEYDESNNFGENQFNDSGVVGGAELGSGAATGEEAHVDSDIMNLLVEN